MRLEKLNKHVNFPLLLDMSPYTSSQAVNASRAKKIIYSLYGVVEHSGKLNSGHYTAYVKAGLRKCAGKLFLSEHRLCHLNKMMNSYLSRENGANADGESGSRAGEAREDKWFYVSDSQVMEVNVARVQKCQAYILFYERLQ